MAGILALTGVHKDSNGTKLWVGLGFVTWTHEQKQP